VRGRAIILYFFAGMPGTFRKMAKMTDSPESNPSDDDIGPEFFRDMRELLATLPPNKDHRLIVLIKASINRGARTRARLSRHSLRNGLQARPIHANYEHKSQQNPGAALTIKKSKMTIRPLI
jgi:hypothetical protein